MIYLASAEAVTKITGEQIPAPMAAASDTGPLYEMNDDAEVAVAGSANFAGLKSAFVPDKSDAGAA